jgi:outer membrane protein TolC
MKISLFILFLFLFWGGYIEGKELSLDVLPQYFIQHNTKLHLAGLDYKIAEDEERASEGSLDWTLFATAFQEKKIQKTNSSLDLIATTETNQGFSLGLKKIFLHGTEFELSLQSLKITSNSLNAISPERYQSAWSASIKQPLLRGFGAPSAHDKYAKAPLKTERYRNKFFLALNEEFKDLVGDFLEVYLLQEVIKIQEASVDYFKTLYDYTNEAMRVGVKSKIDYLDVKAKYERELTLLLKKKNEYVHKKALLLKNLEDYQGSLNLQNDLQLTLNKSFITPENFSEFQSLKSSIIKQEMSESRVDLEKSKKDTLPKLDLQFKINSAGLATGQSKAIQPTLRYQYPTFVAGVQLSWNFGGEKEEGEKKYQLSRIAELSHQYQKEISKASKLEAITRYKKQYNKDQRDLFEENTAFDIEKLEYRTMAYKNGTISFLDLSQSYNDIEDTKISNLESKVDEYRIINDLAAGTEFYLQFFKNKYGNILGIKL